jgi:kinesin family protein 6/9
VALLTPPPIPPAPRSVGEDNRTVSVSLKRTEQGLINNSADAIQFEFDTILHDASQESVFTQCAAEVCESVLAGYNGTVFAYGQTGAGKTYTMSGDAGSDYKQRGVIPRAVHHLFREMDVRVGKDITLSVSYLEIYNEGMYDLLADEIVPDSDLVVVDRDGEMEVKHLTKKKCRDEAEALRFFFAGERNRAVADHVLNKTSSRSHCVFTVHLESRSVGDGDDRTVVSKLNLVDLAGSERVKKTNVTGKALLEATHINKSLTFLEQTVNALSRGDKHVAFRQSKLTSVLRDALGGNCKTTMIACTWPDEAHAEETISTCRFASRVMTLSTRAVVNESKDPRVLAAKYERRCEELLRELAARDTFAGKAPVNYGPMGEVERRELESEVRMFLETENANADDVPAESLRQVREAFRLFKKAYLEAVNETDRRVAEAREETMKEALKAGAGEAAAEENGGEEKEKAEGAEGEGEAEGDAPAEGEDATGDDAAVGDEDADASGFAAGVAPADAAPPPESPQRAKNDVAMTRAAETARKAAASRVEAEQREVAFAEYKKSVSPERAAEAAAASARLKEAKASLKEAVETVNTLKAEIDALGVAVDEAKAKSAAERGAGEPADVVDAETYESMVALKKTKARYRSTFEEVKRLKASLPDLTTAAAETRAALVKEFQEWYDKGGGLDLLVQRDADEDDMDYGEKFDQLELQRALNRDPESGAFFAAKKGLLGSTKRVPVTRTVQHMRALASTQRRAF